MKSSRKFTLITALLSVTFILFGAILISGGTPELAVKPVYATTMASDYSYFENGFKYDFTDISKVENYHNNMGSEDTTTVTVDSSQTKGTLTNPFVISTAGEWLYFVDQMNKSSAKGLNQYFVLGADLDFKGETFQPVSVFNGSFYGLGRYMKNINYGFASSATNCGIFCQLNSSAVITDLNIEQLVFTGMKFWSGSIVGTTYGGSLLNCHALCTLTATQTDVGNSFGGLIGRACGSYTVYLYRCSVKSKMTAYTPSLGKYIPIAGILGTVYSNATTNIYDCFAVTDVNVNGAECFYGGIVNYCADVPIGNQKVENCVAYTNAVDNTTFNFRLVYGTLFNGYNTYAGYGTANYAPFKLDTKNTYTSGRLVATGVAGVKDLYGGLHWLSSVGSITATASNVNWYAAAPYADDRNSTNKNCIDLFANKGLTGAAQSKQYKGTAGQTQEDMYAAVAADAKFSNRIWSNKSVINNAYMTDTDITSTSGYSIKNSPVRNASVRKSTIKYANLRVDTDGTERDESVGITDMNYKGGANVVLPSPTEAANHTFIGWTDDKSGESDPFFDLPDYLYEENVTLYAMWSAPSNIASPIFTATSIDLGNDLVVNGGDASITYAKGSIILTADLQLNKTIMSDATAEFRWTKDGTEISGIYGNKYNDIKNVKDSGAYQYSYVFYSASEPLWRGKGTGASINVTVNPAKITFDKMEYGTDEHPFVGMTYGQLTAKPVMKDTRGDVIEGTAAWGQTALSRIEKDETASAAAGADVDVVTFLFTPADKYNGNYGGQSSYTVNLPVEYMKISFEMPLIGQTITENLEYNDSYTFNNIADLFDTAFKREVVGSMDDAAVDAVLGGNTPCLEFDGKAYKIDEYRALTNGTTGSATAYPTVKNNITINVTFQQAMYKATFKYNDAAGTADLIQNLPYGKRVVKPTDPKNGSHLFLGWYHTVLVNEITGETKSVAWDFDTDRITGNVVLTAQWLLASDLLSITVVQKPGVKFTAREALDLTKFNVTAHFKGDLPEGGTQNLDALVTTGLSSANGILHVDTDGDGFTTVTITYTADLTSGPKSVTQSVKIKVDPILVTTEDFIFTDKSVVYDGLPKSLRGIGTLPTTISDVTYTYEDADGNPIDESNVINRGVYSVTAHFVTGKDYKADDRYATLYITAQATEVTVKWDKTSFTFNGTVQHPVPTFESDGVELPLQYTLTGVDNAINAGAYTVTVVLVTNGYTIKAGQESTSFNISRATLDAPTITSADIYYNGGIIDLADTAANYLTGFDPNIMEFVSGGDGKNAGKYKAIIKFKTSAQANCSWAGGGNTVTVDWEIKKAVAVFNWDNYKFLLEAGVPKAPVVTDINGICDEDLKNLDLSTLVYGGHTAPTDVGVYKISARFPTGTSWTDNYAFENTEYDFVIVPDDNTEVIEIHWDNGDLVYNGTQQAPGYNVVDMDGNPVSSDVLSFLEFNIPESIWAGTYTATVNVKDGAPFLIRSGGTCTYNIKTDPVTGDGTKPGGNGNGGGLPENFPMWQVAAIIGALLIFAILCSKMNGYANRIRKAKAETDDYNNRTYAMLPVFSATAVLFGMSNMIWSILAFAAIGIMTVGIIATIIMRKKCVNAEAETIQAKREDNKRRIQSELDERMRREEEQQRRDDEMKMMFMGMMNMRGGNGASGGETTRATAQDTAAIVSEVVNQLLPKLTAMLPAASAAAATSDRNINIHVNGVPGGISYETDDDEAEYAETAESDEGEEWDTMLDDDDEEEIYETDENGEKVKRLPSNFRQRIKLSSEKNRLWYTAVKNTFCAQKGVSYRVSGRVEKFKYEGQLIAVIGVAKRSLRLWLALNPNDYDVNRYHQKDVSDKPRFIDVPMYVKISSERALGHAQELLAAMFEQKGVETRRRYVERDIQELIFTLKHNKLLKDKENKALLCESVHVHDCDALKDEVAENCLESKNVAIIDEGVFEDVRLDDIDANFLDGQKVTLEHLKKKGLVSEDCTGYNVTAGSRLSKPLVVYANDFTLPAIKMIVLTGGRAIRLTKI